MSRLCRQCRVLFITMKTVICLLYASLSLDSARFDCAIHYANHYCDCPANLIDKDMKSPDYDFLQFRYRRMSVETVETFELLNFDYVLFPFVFTHLNRCMTACLRMSACAFAYTSSKSCAVCYNISAWILFLLLLSIPIAYHPNQLTIHFTNENTHRFISEQIFTR